MSSTKPYIVYIYVVHRVGEIGDVYRPLGTDNGFKEFAFVGFYDKTHVDGAIAIMQMQSNINDKDVTVEEAKTWILELYPKAK